MANDVKYTKARYVQLFLDRKAELLLVDWTDEQVTAAADTILRALTICAVAARRNGDRDWLEEFSWFVEYCRNEVGEMAGFRPPTVRAYH